MKRLISFILCLIMVVGLMPAEAIAAYLPEQEQEITPIGDIDGVPILSEEDAIRAAESTEIGFDSDSEFVDVLLSDSKEAEAFFDGNEESDGIGANYWNNLKPYQMIGMETDEDGNVKTSEIGPGEDWKKYCIVMENGERWPIFRYVPDDKGRYKMYYLYCLYKTTVVSKYRAYEMGTENISAYGYQYFYCTLPYCSYTDSNGTTINNVVDWTVPCDKTEAKVKIVDWQEQITPTWPNATPYGPNGLPIPKSICDVRGLRTYSHDDMRWGNNTSGKLITDSTHGITYAVYFSGMEELWFNYSSVGDAGKWESTYKNFQNNGKFEYPDKNGNTPNQNLKNVIDCFP